MSTPLATCFRLRVWVRNGTHNFVACLALFEHEGRISQNEFASEKCGERAFVENESYFRQITSYEFRENKVVVLKNAKEQQKLYSLLTHSTGGETQRTLVDILVQGGGVPNAVDSTNG